MDDLISRAAAIAQIKENYCDWCDHTDLCQSCETRDCIATIEQQLPAVDAIPVEWLSSKAAQAEHDIFYCKGDARRNAEIMRSAIVVMELWKKEQEAR